MHKKFISHSFHLVTLSPWPIVGSISGGLIALGLTTLLHKSCAYLLSVGVLLTAATMALWWRDVIREATYQGSHTQKVVHGLEIGMILFITSEVMFFVAFFWAFFHSSLAPAPELGCSWPPAGVAALNPFSIPLLNTAVLLSSGATVTWAHHGLLNNYKCELSWGLGATVALGLYFTSLQVAEYASTSFSLSDSVFGSTFFIATGFHGAHVLIGSLFLSICFIRARQDHFSSSRHMGLEAAAWYWHFVDVVWLFLYLCLYWWSY